MFFCLFQVGGPVDVITCESKVACKFSVFVSVNRVFEKDFEGFRSWECRIRHRINLLYLLNLAEPQKVQILRGRHPNRLGTGTGWNRNRPNRNCPIENRTEPNRAFTFLTIA